MFFTKCNIYLYATDNKYYFFSAVENLFYLLLF